MVSLDGMVPHVVDKKILNKIMCYSSLTVYYLIFKKLKRLISCRPLLLFFFVQIFTVPACPSIRFSICGQIQFLFLVQPCTALVASIQ